MKFMNSKNKLQMREKGSLICEKDKAVEQE